MLEACHMHGGVFVFDCLLFFLPDRGAMIGGLYLI